MIFPGSSLFAHLLLLFGFGIMLVTAAPQRPKLGPNYKEYLPPSGRVIIGYRTVTKAVARQYNALNLLLPFTPAHDSLGPGIYMTTEKAQFRWDYEDESFCVIAAYPRIFDELDKVWIPPTNCEGDFLYDPLGKKRSDLSRIDEFIDGTGADTDMSVRISRTNVALNGRRNIIQMALSKGLLTKEEQKRLGIWVKCTIYHSDLSPDVVNVKNWKNVVWTPEEELAKPKKGKDKKKGDGCECM